jgi:hypothetical protein
VHDNQGTFGLLEQDCNVMIVLMQASLLGTVRSGKTKQMVANFERGGAAINQLAELAGADLRVVPTISIGRRVISPRHRR